jgi:O-antigen/teichoic acid export membrane protein
VQAVMLPKTAAFSDADANRTTPVYFRQVTIVMLAIGLLMVIFSKPLLAIFGPEFVRGQTALILLLIGVVFAGQNALLTTHIMGRGRPQFVAIATAISLPLTVMLSLWLIPTLGLMGAAIATVAPRGAITLLSIWYFGSITGGEVAELWRFRRSDLKVFSEIAHRLGSVVADRRRRR